MLRQAYLKTMSKATVEKYVPATYEAVRGSLEAAATLGEPLQILFKESIALGIALSCSRYVPDVAA